MEKDLEKLIKALNKECGRKHVEVYDYWDDDTDDDTCTEIDVLESDQDDAREIILEHGFEIKKESWYSGSDSDGYCFIIK